MKSSQTSHEAFINIKAYRDNKYRLAWTPELQLLLRRISQTGALSQSTGISSGIAVEKTNCGDVD